MTDPNAKQWEDFYSELYHNERGKRRAITDMGSIVRMTTIKMASYRYAATNCEKKEANVSHENVK